MKPCWNKSIVIYKYFTALYWFEEELGDRVWNDLYKSLIPVSHYREVLLLLFAMMVHGGRRRSAETVLKRAREQFWEHIGIDPGTISRGMVIENPEKVTKQLNHAYKQGTVKFLQCAHSALVDCMHFDTEERDCINNSFQRIELYNQFITISVMKSIQSIQVTTVDYKKALDLDLDLDPDHDPDHNLLTLKELRPLLDNDLNKINNNCHRILEKTPAIINADHKLYIRFSSLVLYHIGFILFYRWRFLEYKLDWNYPDLDRFVDTAGGLLDPFT